MDYQLIYIGEHSDGFTRKGRGKGFEYFDRKGQKIKDPTTIERINELKIPPNWQDVWISPDPRGHIQAVGKDARNRSQYLYHELWQQYRNSSKFKKLEEFAKCLPQIRKKASKDIKLEGWPKEKVMGLIVLTLDEAYLRIGNEFYKNENETFGLTTIRRRHLHFHDNMIDLEFKAKSGKYRKINIKNNHLVNLIKECAELPGYEIFRYKQRGASTAPVDSSDVNLYLKNISNENFSSKDFRTWGGTVLALEKFPHALEMTKKNKRLKLNATLVKLVAKILGNTQSICRNYYIHPAILNLVDQNKLNKLYFDEYPTRKYELSAAENKALELIADFKVEKINVKPQMETAV